MNIINQDINTTLKSNYMPYAMSVICERALPNIDGFKPSHVKLLYTMYTMGLLKSSRTKSANIVGQTMKLNPHGDCLYEDTNILLANGEMRTIKELYTDGENVDVLAVDSNGKEVIARASHFRIGQYTNKIYEIKLSDGGVIRTTNNHPFLLRDLTWVKAEALKLNDQLYTANVNIDIDGKSFRPSIKSTSNTLAKLIQNLVSGDIIHHKDENFNNNELSNLLITNRADHARLHKENAILGLANGLDTMFNDEYNRELIGEKNSKLMKLSNKYQALYKAYKVLDYMIENSIELTEENYINNRLNASYNAPTINKLYTWTTFNIENFNHLLNLHKIRYSPVKEAKITCSKELNTKKTTKIHSDKLNNTHSMINMAQHNKIFDVFDLIVKNNADITIENYAKYRSILISSIGNGMGNINNRNHMKAENISHRFDNIVEEYRRTRVFVTEINVVECENTPMYDFTVDGYENMMICTSNSGYTHTMISVHNSAIYETMVRLTRGYDALNTPFIDSKGNFGKVYSRDMAYAASRYTEAKLSPIAKELFKGIDSDVVDMKDNYDGKMKEPVLLPVTFPNILANCNKGIAVGMASNICSFNLSELCDYTIDALNGVEVQLLIPDFTTGGEILLDLTALRNINDNGEGSVKVRSKYTYDKENSCIDINEIPYTTTVEAIIDKIEDLVKSGKVKEITDVRDETDLDGLKLTIDIKKNTNPELFMQKLFKMTPLEDSFPCNFNVLIDGKPKVLGVKSIIEEWVKFRKVCLRREMSFNINKLSEEENELLGLKIVILDIDKAISIIRHSEDKEVVSNLISQMKLNEAQAEYVADIKLRNLNQSHLAKKIERLETLKENLHSMRNNLESDEYYKSTIINQLTEIKTKYGKERRTIILKEDTVETVTQSDLIENFNNQIVLTKEGYFKRTLKYSESNKTKDGDEVIQQIPSTNKSKLLFFTDKANCYYMNAWEIPTVQPSTLGSYLSTLLQLQDEKIIKVVSTEDFNGYVLFAFENGRVAKINLSSYATKTNRTKVINAYNSISPLVSIHHIEKDCDFMAISSESKALVFNSDQINSKDGKSSQGVNVLRSRNDSVMIEFKPCDDGDYENYRCNIPAVGKKMK